MSYKSRLQGGLDAKRMSRADLARATGLNASTITKHLDKETAPRDWETIAKIARVLGMDPHWLATGRNQELTNAAGTAGAVPIGRDALELVLRDYQWPDDVEMPTIDAAEAEARRQAVTETGQYRSVSAWRAFLARFIRPKSDKRKAAPRAV